jgi:serine/threonine-protein kinase
MKSPEDRWPTAASMREALLADRAGVPPWRVDNREPVRYTSPRPDGPRPELRAVSPRRGTAAAEARPSHALADQLPNGIMMEPSHLAFLTEVQREDLRLWHGRVSLLDRVKGMRGYAWLTFGAYLLSMAGIAMALEGDAPPLIIAPIIPLYMSMKLLRRGRSLRSSGLRLRRVLLMPLARQVIPKPARETSSEKLEKLAPREVLNGPLGATLRRAVDDRAAILQLAAKLPKEERSQLKELEPTVNALVERVASVAEVLHRLDQSMDPRLVEEIDARIAAAHSESSSPDRERRLSMLGRQRATFDDILQRRALLARQLDNAGLALGSLRLDLIKFGSSGLQSALSDVSSATQEARALSREIGLVLDAAAEVQQL